MPTPKIYTIAQEKPFIDVLAHGILERFGTDPLALSRVLVLLPSRRACRSLREAFLRATSGKPLLLPRMQPIGEADEDELLLGEGELDIPPAIAPLTRLLLLTRQVAIFQRAQRAGETNIEQSARLAYDLARFIDEVTREGLFFDQLSELVPEDFASHWQVTLEFLTIISHGWPGLLEERGMLEPVMRRQLLMDRLSQDWQDSPPPHPIIAAGTTGSIPSTARLLKVIARLPQGMVILPGLDTSLTREQWEHIDPPHPQYGLKLLLEQLRCEAGAVEYFDAPVTGAAPARLELLNEALRPASMTDGWRELAIDTAAALEGVRYVSASGPQEEARIIALMLRETLETPGKTAALVTPDRDLARRVASIMWRFGVTIDDSAGKPLADTPPATFLRLLAEMAASHAAPVPLLALAKHPFAACAMETRIFREGVRELEKAALRGVRFAPGFAAITQALKENQGAAQKCTDALEMRCRDFLTLMSQREVNLRELLEAHLTCAEAMAETPEEDGATRLWGREEGEQLASFIAELREAAVEIEEIDPASYPGLLDTLLAGQVFRPRFGMHPRLHILSPMEARLQHFDRVILGGMNEECWPQNAGGDPWMSRPMRARFGLPSPEKMVGMAAHDMLMLAGSPELIFTRAEKSDGAPTIPSRWLLRLQALLKALPLGQPLMADARWAAWAAQLDTPQQRCTFTPPAPCPPLAARPRRLSVTQVETLQRDPYGIYARHILKLEALDPVDKEPDMAEFGTLIHRVLELFVKRYPAALPPDAYAQLLEEGRRCFASLLDRPAIVTFWWPRFERIAQWLVEEEAARRGMGMEVLAESRGEWKFTAPGGEFALRAVIDRLEVQASEVRIIDYKTGQPPAAAQLARGLACQLPLEALIVEKGQITSGDMHPGINFIVTELEYWRLRGGEEGGEIRRVSEMKVKNRPLELRALISQAEAGLRQLIAAFDQPHYPYHSYPVPDHIPRYSDYEHLARLKEWGMS